MENDQKIKTLIAGFLNCSPENINESTLITRETLKSSIIVHRMYATLKSEGIAIDDYSEIKTYKELLNSIPANNDSFEFRKVNYTISENNDTVSIGIDIENINKFPDVADYREDEFYKTNFSPGEIAYCILKHSPKQSFAGLFAAKEALVKAENSLRKINFSEIEILHDKEGKPTFDGFAIAISHSDPFAISVAVKAKNISDFKPKEPIKKIIQKEKYLFLPIYKFLLLLCLLMSIICILFTFVNSK